MPSEMNLSLRSIYQIEGGTGPGHIACLCFADTCSWCVDDMHSLSLFLPSFSPLFPSYKYPFSSTLIKSPSSYYPHHLRKSITSNCYAHSSSHPSPSSDLSPQYTPFSLPLPTCLFSRFSFSCSSSISPVMYEFGSSSDCCSSATNNRCINRTCLYNQVKRRETRFASFYYPPVNLCPSHHRVFALLRLFLFLSSLRIPTYTSSLIVRNDQHALPTSYLLKH